MPVNTLLELSGIDLGDYAVRGLQLELAPIEPGDLERDINGGLHDLTLTAFRKYRLTISCTDQEAPELTDVWRGKPVTVTCLPRALMGVSSGDTGETPLVMSCLVDQWSNAPSEWAHQTSWQLVLLEV